MGNIFIDTIALRHHHAPADQVFSEIIRVKKASKIVLDLFFKRFDACLVDDWTLDAISELNPQIKKALHVVAESPPMVTSVTFFRREFGEQLKKEIKNNTRLADRSSYGKQLLLLFKSDGIEYLDYSDLTGFYQMVYEYEARMARWKAELKKQPNKNNN